MGYVFYKNPLTGDAREKTALITPGKNTLFVAQLIE